MRYKSFMQATQDIRHDYIVEGLRTGEIYRKYSIIVQNTFTMGSLKTWIHDCGLPAVRKKLDRQRKGLAIKAKASLRKKIENSVNQEHGEALAMEVKELALVRERKAQEKHTKRMSKQADRAYDAIKDVEISDPNDDDSSGMSVRGFVGLITDFDKLGRKIYRMDDNTVLSAHQFNIAVLTNQASLTGKEPDAMEAELVEEA